MKATVLCVVLFIASTCVAQATEPLDTFRIGTITLRPGIEAHAQILSRMWGNVSPLYHAHGLLHLLPSLTMNDVVSLRLRTVAEAWSFSSAYDSPTNRRFWALPSIRARVVGGGWLDSITILGGDLWRIKNGQGLALDYFEALGVNVAAHFDKVVVEATTAGYGWTGSDDIYMMNVRYDSLVRLSVFANFSGPFTDIDPRGADRLIFSIDATTPQFYGFSAYAEAARARFQATALLAGIKFGYKDDETNIEVQAEGRMYERGFFPPNDFITVYPYINSITSLDKPVNTYRSWIQESSGFYARLRVRRSIIAGFFFTTDTEYLSTRAKIFSETCIGYTVTDNVDITAGYLNKAFTLFDRFEAHMFEVSQMTILKMTARF